MLVAHGPEINRPWVPWISSARKVEPTLDKSVRSPKARQGSDSATALAGK